MTLNKLALVLGFACLWLQVRHLLLIRDTVLLNSPVQLLTRLCSITPDTENQTVPLGQISTAALKDGGRSNSRDFKIALENCTTETYKTVQTTFTGSEAADILPVPRVLRGLPKTRRLLLPMRAANRSN